MTHVVVSGGGGGIYNDAFKNKEINEFQSSLNYVSYIC